MKTKSIDIILQKKIKDWASTIDDINVRKLVLKNTIITGGCITSMLLKENINDFDVYFRNKKTALAVAKYYTNKNKLKKTITIKEKEDRISLFIKSNGVISQDKTKQYDPEITESESDIQEIIRETSNKIENACIEVPNRYKPVFFSENAITLSNKIQIVMRFFGEPEEIHKNYDFVHCTNYWVSWGNTKKERLNLNIEAMECIFAKELRYSGSLYPLCSIIRLRKFIKRGWTINAGQILKMCVQISNLDLTDYTVLKEQLIGVDVAYFDQVIGIIKKAQDSGTKIDNTYLVEIIDRMF